MLPRKRGRTQTNKASHEGSPQFVALAHSAENLQVASSAPSCWRSQARDK